MIVNLDGGGVEPGDYLFPPAIFAAWWTLGRFLRARHLLTEELRERTARLERERDELGDRGRRRGASARGPRAA